MKFLAYLRAFSALGSHPGRCILGGQAAGPKPNPQVRVIIDLSPFGAIRDDDFPDKIREDSNTSLRSQNPLHKRFRIALGGGRSIQLSYADLYEIGGFLGLPTVCLFFS